MDKFIAISMSLIGLACLLSAAFLTLCAVLFCFERKLRPSWIIPLSLCACACWMGALFCFVVAPRLGKLATG